MSLQTCLRSLAILSWLIGCSCKFHATSSCVSLNSIESEQLSWALYVTVREEPYRPSRRGRVRKTLFGVKTCSTMHNSEDKLDRRVRRAETKTCWSHLLSSTSLYSGRAFKEGSVYTFHHRMSRLCLSGDAVEL